MYLLTHKKSECYGCTACEQICSHGAIKMQEDEDGFVYPVKNLELCTNCGLCEKVCPFGTNANPSEPDIYAAYAQNNKVRAGSSSGAIFYLIARRVIEKGGIVYGAALNKEINVLHQKAETIEELQLLRGSKYVQSDLTNTYREIRSHLRNGRIVYFVGTGCQVAGLRSFLLKKYDNLLTSDLVCHGVPSLALFKKHIKYLEERHQGKVIDYKFRDNKGWGGCERVSIKKKDRRIKEYYLPSYYLSPYLYSFMYAMTYRDSCYVCPFASVPRRGDITLADFWGAETFYPNLDTSKGISLVLANSEIGTKWFEEIKSELVFEISDLQKASEYNKNLVTHTNRPVIRDKVFPLLHKVGYSEVAKTTFRPSNYLQLKIKYTILNLVGQQTYIKLKKMIGRT